MRSSPSQPLHLVVLSLGDLPITTQVCHCVYSLGLEAKKEEGGDSAQIAYTAITHTLGQLFSNVGPKPATAISPENLLEIQILDSP